MRSHVCTHGDGRSHICDCKLQSSHGAFQNSCSRYADITKDDSHGSKFQGEIHNHVTDPSSGAGNCLTCNRPLEAPYHPHIYRAARDYIGCVCGKPRSALIHQMTAI